MCKPRVLHVVIIVNDNEVYSLYNEIPEDVFDYGKRKIDTHINEGTITDEINNSINNSFTVSIDSQGIVTINGAPKAKVFIKISDGIDMTDQANNAAVIKKWIEKGTLIAKKGQLIEQKFTHISGTVTGTQFNAVLRTTKNIASEIKCAILSDIYDSTGIISEDVNVSYLYATEDTVFNNYKFKVDVYEKEMEVVTEGAVSSIIKSCMIPNSTATNTAAGNDITCIINNDYTVTLSGKVGTSNLFIKLSERQAQPKIEFAVGTLSTNWAQDSSTIIPINKPMKFSVKELGGVCDTTTSGQFNVCLIASDNTSAYNCKTKDGIYEIEDTTTKELKVLYFFASAGTVFTDYRILINIE